MAESSLELGDFVEKRRTGNQNIILAVIAVIGMVIFMLSGAIAYALVLSVRNAAETGKELSPGLTALLVGTVSTTLGAAVGYVGGLLSNPQSAQHQSTPREIGQGIAEASQITPVKTKEAGANEGLADETVSAVSSESSEEDEATESDAYEQTEPAQRGDGTDTIDPAFFTDENHNGIDDSLEGGNQSNGN